MPIETSITAADRAILETNNIVLHDLASELDTKFKSTQRETAKKILNRFIKRTKLADAEV